VALTKLDESSLTELIGMAPLAFDVNLQPLSKVSS
jgi:hypothetical protein